MKPNRCENCGSELLENDDGTIECINPVCNINDLSGNYDPY